MLAVSIDVFMPNVSKNTIFVIIFKLPDPWLTLSVANAMLQRNRR